MLNIKVPQWLPRWPKMEKKPGSASFARLPKSDQDIILQIVGQFVDRARKDIKTWRDGLTLAEDPENPRWDTLQDLFEYLRPDGHLGSVWETVRKGATTSARGMIRDKKTKIEQPEKTELLRAEWFQNLIGECLDSVLYAYTLVQFRGWKTEKGKTFPWFELIPRRNIIPQRGLVLLEIGQDKAIDFKDPYYDNVIIWVQNQYKWGIMNDMVTSLIYKKNSEESWAEFSEKFGMPLVTAVTNKRDKKELDRIQGMLEQLGEAARAVLPEGTTITVHDQQGKSDPYNIYDKRIERSEATISKRILGGTMVTDNGSSRSQSEVHERTLSKIVGELDKRLVESTVNNQLLPILATWGMPFTENDEYVYERVEDLSIMDQWKIVKEATDMFEIDVDWIAEKFRIPITGIKEKPVVLPGTGGQAGNFSSPSEAQAATTPEGFSQVWPVYKQSSCCKHYEITATGIPSKILERLNKLILHKVYHKQEVSEELAQKAIAEATALRDGLYSGWGNRRTDITYDATDLGALSAMEHNLFHFSMVKQKASVFTLNQLLIDQGSQNVRTFEDFAALAEPHLESFDRARLRTEYNFTIAVGQNASRYHQFLSEAESVTQFLQYQTVGDSRVRASHQALDGMIFSIRDPEARKLFGPNDWGCRCEFIQYLGDPGSRLSSGAEGLQLVGWNDKQEKIFGINRGEIGKVFSANQMYLKEHNIAEDVRKLNYTSYGMKSWKETKGDFESIQIDNTISDGNVSELFKKEPGSSFMGYTDYLGRKITLHEGDFKKTLSGKNKTSQLFPHISDVVTNPDEVYFSQFENGRFETRYIKFYQDTALVVPVEISDDVPIIRSWYEMQGNEKATRKGLLIYTTSLEQ